MRNQIATHSSFSSPGRIHTTGRNPPAGRAVAGKDATDRRGALRLGAHARACMVRLRQASRMRSVASIGSEVQDGFRTAKQQLEAAMAASRQLPTIRELLNFDGPPAPTVMTRSTSATCRTSMVPSQERTGYPGRELGEVCRRPLTCAAMRQWAERRLLIARVSPRPPARVKSRSRLIDWQGLRLLPSSVFRSEVLGEGATSILMSRVDKAIVRLCKISVS